MMLKSVRVLKVNQRGAVFRLGKFKNIVDPGWVVIVPFIDRLFKVDLNLAIPNWQGLSQEQLSIKVKDIVLQEFK
jgi:regulator of protease activity HflC (stomatin/prohibitin superfamily)